MTEENELNIFELRAHHITTFMDYLRNLDVLYLSNQGYLTYIKKQCLYEYPDKFLLEWRNILRDLHKNPNKKFKFVKGSDSVCERCNYNYGCNTPGEHHELIQNLDKKAVEEFPELKVGEIYDANDLTSLLIVKGLLEE